MHLMHLMPAMPDRESSPEIRTGKIATSYRRSHFTVATLAREATVMIEP